MGAAKFGRLQRVAKRIIIKPDHILVGNNNDCYLMSSFGHWSCGAYVELLFWKRSGDSTSPYNTQIQKGEVEIIHAIFTG